MKDEEFAKFDLKYNDLLQDRGFNSKKEMYYPKAKSNYCCADSSVSWVIDSEGYMYNCWNEVGNAEKASGNIMDLEDVPDKMISNNKGDIYTNVELLNKRIDQINANVKTTQELAKRMDLLEISLARTEEGRRIHQKMDVLYKEISQFLPHEMRGLKVKMDDCCTELLDMYAEYFYKNGYYDGRESDSMLNCR
jgi:hypothetical protein